MSFQLQDLGGNTVELRDNNTSAKFDQIGNEATGVEGNRWFQRLGIKRTWTLELKVTSSVDEYLRLLYFWDYSRSRTYTLTDSSLQIGPFAAPTFAVVMDSFEERHLSATQKSITIGLSEV